jgi:hypothetical protein
MTLTETINMTPQNIDEVIARLNEIIDDSLRGAHRIGYFAALYERVTTNVRRALVAGNIFQDNARMEKLDVVFADRFLAAWDAFQSGGQLTESWRLAFSVLGDEQPLVVQHLMLGMNAHINLDLGIAAATVAPTPQEIESLKADFMMINNILARLVGVVELELGQVCPRFGRIERFSPHLESKLFDFGMDAARDLAWSLAEQLAAAEQGNWDDIIARRDAETAMLGKTLYPLFGIAGRVANWIRTSESTDIRLNIQIIAE